jgi:hypothetical protein
MERFAEYNRGLLDQRGPVNQPQLMYPTFQDPYSPVTQSALDIGRVTVGMENPLGDYTREQLGPEAVKNIVTAIELAGLGSLALQGGKGVRNVSRKFTPKGRKKAQEALKKAQNKKAARAIARKLGTFGAKRMGLAGLAAGLGAAFPPTLAVTGPVVAGLSILDLLADKDIRGMLPELATKEGLKKMPSALERETAQREAAKQRTSGLTSLLEARVKP